MSVSARSEDPLRLHIEDALGAIADAQERLRCVSLRITHKMRTQEEAELLSELNLGRAALERAKQHLSRLHPQGTREV